MVPAPTVSTQTWAFVCDDTAGRLISRLSSAPLPGALQETSPTPGRHGPRHRKVRHFAHPPALACGMPPVPSSRGVSETRKTSAQGRLSKGKGGLSDGQERISGLGPNQVTKKNPRRRQGFQKRISGVCPCFHPVRRFFLTTQLCPLSGREPTLSGSPCRLALNRNRICSSPMPSALHHPDVFKSVSFERRLPWSN